MRWGGWTGAEAVVLPQPVRKAEAMAEARTAIRIFDGSRRIHLTDKG